MKLFMDVYPVMHTYGYFVHYVMLTIKIDSGINLIVVAENVCLSGIHSNKKDGNYLIWTQKFFFVSRDVHFVENEFP